VRERKTTPPLHTLHLLLAQCWYVLLYSSRPLLVIEGLADDATIPHVKLDLTDEQEAEAAINREAMYQRATRSA